MPDTFGCLLCLLLCWHYRPVPTYIVPIIDYWDTVWSLSKSTDTCRLERLHSKFTSSVPSSGNSNLNLSLCERRVFHTTLQIVKIVYIFFSFTVDITGRSGRNQQRLFAPRIRTNYGKQSLAYRGTGIWNKLPSTLYSAKSVTIF